MLLELTEIQKRLDDQWLRLEPMLTGYRLVLSGVTKEDIERFEQQLDVVLPEHFARMLQEFNFGQFTLGPIAFGYGGDYLSWSLDLNQPDLEYANNWWGSGARPEGILMIAGADGCFLMLNCVTGSVSACMDENDWKGQSVVVAKDFDLFIRGLGTIFLNRNSEDDREFLAEQIAREVEGRSGIVFWRWLAE